MTKQIIWSPMAIDDLAMILQYLQKKWSRKVSNDFINHIGKMIDSISSYPTQFPSVYRIRILER